MSNPTAHSHESRARQADELRADEIHVDELRADELDMDELQADKLRTGALQADKLHMGALQADDLRADALQAALERIEAGPDHDVESDPDAGYAEQPQLSGELAALVATAHAVHMHRPRPNPAFRAQLQVELIHLIEAEGLAPASTPAATKSRHAGEAPVRGRLVPQWRRLVLRMAGAAIALIALLGSMVAASANSRPGELLYPVRRGVEQVQESMARMAQPVIETLVWWSAPRPTAQAPVVAPYRAVLPSPTAMTGTSPHQPALSPDRSAPVPAASALHRPDTRPNAATLPTTAGANSGAVVPAGPTAADPARSGAAVRAATALPTPVVLVQATNGPTPTTGLIAVEGEIGPTAIVSGRPRPTDGHGRRPPPPRSTPPPGSSPPPWPTGWPTRLEPGTPGTPETPGWPGWPGWPGGPRPTAGPSPTPYTGPTGSVSGRIFGYESRPLEGAWVAFFPVPGADAEVPKGIMPRYWARTDRDGRYQIVGLPVGLYKVVASAYCMFYYCNTRWFPDAAHSHEATAITVVAGGTLDGVNIRFERHFFWEP